MDQYKLKYRGGPYNAWCCAKQNIFMSALISGTMEPHQRYVSANSTAKSEDLLLYKFN